MILDQGRGASAPRHVFLALPTYHGKFAPEFVASATATETLLRANGWEITIGTVLGDCYIQAARNRLVADFLATECSHLFFLDDDIGWPPEAALALLEMPDDIVFGVYPKKAEVEAYPVVIHCDAQGYPVVRADGAIAAAGAPTGFLRISRCAIERLVAAYPDQRYEVFAPDGAFLRHEWDLFPQGARHGRWWGEDFAFCNLWTALGREIWCWPDIDFVHVGARAFHGNYHRFLMAQPRSES